MTKEARIYNGEKTVLSIIGAWKTAAAVWGRKGVEVRLLLRTEASPGELPREESDSHTSMIAAHQPPGPAGKASSCEASNTIHLILNGENFPASLEDIECMVTGKTTEEQDPESLLLIPGAQQDGGKSMKDI